MLAAATSDKSAASHPIDGKACTRYGDEFIGTAMKETRTTKGDEKRWRKKTKIISLN
jgi:hypothetical protein